MINPTNCKPFWVASAGDRRPGNGGQLLLLLPRRRLRDAPLQAEDVGRLNGSQKQTKREPPTRRCASNLQHPPRRRQHQVACAVTLPSAFEIDQHHLGNLCSKSRTRRRPTAPGARRSARVNDETPLLNRRCPARPTRSRATAACRDLAFILNGQVNAHPRSAIRLVKGGRLQTIVPVVPDAPIGHFS